MKYDQLIACQTRLNMKYGNYQIQESGIIKFS